MKRENAILTYTNTLFYPLAPVAAEVKLEDIAHALAQMCRANGHFKTFYSVAQHSLNCAREAKARGLPERLQLACLLHDASEAYISDITRPVKHYLEDYKRIERNLQQVIYKRFGISDLTEIECGHIGEIDNALLDHEFKALHYQGLMKNSPRLYASADFAERSMRAVEQEFLIAAGKLLDNKKNVEQGSRCVGLDSCKKTGKYYGWSAFWLETDGSYGFAVYPSITAIMSDHHDAACILIDIPIGLPETPAEAAARPDSELRRQLKKKSSSVFNTPCRQAVYCHNKQAAKSSNQAVLHKSLSEQSLGFMGKIREVDEFLRRNPQYNGKLRESHPEYAFALLNNGQPLISKKDETDGLAERRLVLEGFFENTDRAWSEISLQYPKQLLDDFLDAMVLAVMGAWGLHNGFATIPAQPVKDSRGLPMEVVYSQKLQV
jgi:predicted RNase H-like nuclease